MGIIGKLATYYEAAYRLGHFPSSRVLFTKQKIFAYYGFLGDRNFGDELAFQSAKQLFHPDILLPVRRRMPAHFAVFAHACKSRFSGLVIGGGTLIGPSFYDRSFFESLIAMQKPVYLHGTGVQRMAVWNPGWKRLLGEKFYGGVRGPVSAGNASECKEGIRIAGDAAFFLFGAERPRGDETGRKTVLINCGTHSRFDGQRESRSAIEEFATAAIKMGAEVQFLPCHFVDVDLGREIQRRHPAITLLDIPKGYSEAHEHFRKAVFAVGERLHFTAMAILSGCPLLSINYAAKHEDMLSSVGLSSSGVSPEELSAERIQEAFDARGTFDWDRVFSRINELKMFQQKEAIEFRTL